MPKHSVTNHIALISRFIGMRARTEELIKPLHVEDFTPQSALFASPPKWHIAHTTWFFEEMILKKFNAKYIEFNQSYGYLFNSYYNSIGERVERTSRGLITRPSVDEVRLYRAHVDKHLTAFVQENPSDEILNLLELGINHEQQHQELLLTDLKYTFSLNPTHPVYDPSISFVDRKKQEEGWLKIEDGLYSIGADNEGFTFDNELGKHSVFLHSFSISKKPCVEQ